MAKSGVLLILLMFLVSESVCAESCVGNSTVYAALGLVLPPDNVRCCDGRCQWDVEPTSSYLKMEVNALPPGSRGCPDSAVQVFIKEGTVYQELGRWCQFMTVQPFFYRASTLRVIFLQSSPDHSFQLSFSIAYIPSSNKEALCGREEIIVTEQPTYLYSPNYTSSYPSDLKCTWALRAADESNDVITVEAEAFSLESEAKCNYDSLEISYNDTSRKYCGSVPFTNDTQSSQVNVTFKSDSTQQKSGFALLIYTQPRYNSSCIPGGTRILNASTTSAIIRIPIVGLSGLNCLWQLVAPDPDHVVEITVESWDIQHSSTANCPLSLDIYDGDSTSSQKIREGCAYEQAFGTERGSRQTMLLKLGVRSPQSSGEARIKFYARHKYDFMESLQAHRSYSYLWIPYVSPSSASAYGPLSLAITSSSDLCLTLALFSYNMQRAYFSRDVIVYDGAQDLANPLGVTCTTNSSLVVLRTTLPGTRLEWNPLGPSSGGYWLEFATTTSCSGNPEQLDAYSSPRLILPPVIPLGYPRRGRCEYHLKAPSGQVLNLTAQLSELPPYRCSSNKISVYDDDLGSPLTSWCDGSLPTVFSSDNKMIVVYNFLNSSESINFKLLYTSVAPVTCGLTALTATRNYGTLTSPGYPGYYTNNLNCQWAITAANDNDLVRVQLVFVTFADTSKCEDHLDIYDSSYLEPSKKLDTLCGGYTDNIFNSTGSTMTITMTTNSSHVASGFRLYYYSFPDPRPKYCTSPQSLVAMRDKTQTFTSPNFPQNYPNNLDCLWIIRAESTTDIVVLDVIQSKIELPPLDSNQCFADYVKVYEGTKVDESKKLSIWCGLARPQNIRSLGPAVTVQFITDGQITQAGFNVQYISDTAAANCRSGSAVELIATTNPGTISTPNYPLVYPSDMSCAWRFKAENSSLVVKLTVTFSELEDSYTCQFDRARVYDGYNLYSRMLSQWCGNEIPDHIYSSGEYLLLTFFSDSQNQRRGFEVAYRAVPPPPPATAAPQQGGDNVGIIMGATLGGAVAVILAFVVFICWFKRTRGIDPPAMGGNSSRSRDDDFSNHNTVFVVSPIFITNSNHMDQPPPYPGISNPGFSHLPPEELPPSYLDVVRESSYDATSGDVSRTSLESPLESGSRTRSQSTDLEDDVFTMQTVAPPPAYSTSDLDLGSPSSPTSPYLDQPPSYWDSIQGQELHLPTLGRGNTQDGGRSRGRQGEGEATQERRPRVPTPARRRRKRSRSRSRPGRAPRGEGRTAPAPDPASHLELRENGAASGGAQAASGAMQGGVTIRQGRSKSTTV